jgi:transcriptional regulator with XRE-family HTH domain
MTQPPTARPWTTVLDGRRLQNLRHQHGLSCEELAGRAGISTATVTRLERQARPWRSRRTMARLTAALPITAPQSPGGTGTAETTGSLITAARDLLARTAELPASTRGLHAVISEYRAAVFAFTTEAGPQRHDSTR